VKQKLHIFNVEKGLASWKEHRFDTAICHTADIEGDDTRCMFGGKLGFGVLNLETGEYEYIRKYFEGEEGQEEKETRYRGNDGAVDARGRFVV
jgi:hypothetical protein